MKPNSILTLVLLSLLLLGSARTASAQDQHRYTQQVLLQLRIAALAYLFEGYVAVSRKGNKLNHGRSERYSITLQPGHSYRIQGVCDEDCDGLDLVLYDNSGHLVTHSLKEGSLPTLNIPDWRSGQFMLKVKMHESLV